MYIQSKLHAPKDAYNQFGKYKYRKAEQILEAAKPLLAEKNCTLVISDEIVLVGNSIYVKATSTLTNKKGDVVSAIGWAREAESLSGMSPGQVTGATSSYARKYSLCGLFAIDDTKDLDDESVTNPNGAAQKTAAVSKPSPAPAAKPAAAPAPTAQPQKADKKELLRKISECRNTAQLNGIYRENPSLQSDNDFLNALTNRKNEILKENEAAGS